MWYYSRMGRPTDLSKLPDEELYAELGRRRAAARSTFRGGTAPTCTCGKCPKCKRREAMRQYRANKAAGINQPRGRPKNAKVSK